MSLFTGRVLDSDGTTANISAIGADIQDISIIQSVPKAGESFFLLIVFIYFTIEIVSQQLYIYMFVNLEP